MCGIVGLIAKNQNGFDYKMKDLFTQMLIVGQLRGSDSTGVFGAGTTGTPDIVKGAMHSSEFVCTKAYSLFEHELWSSYKMVVGHNRAATKGNVTGANAHPFQEGKITLVHNGTIRNQEKLNKEVEVDSHAICHALNDNDAKKGLGLIDGAFALSWYDSDAQTLNLARNTERPLSLVEFEDFWAFASEGAMIFWLSARAGIKDGKYEVVPPGRVLSFNMKSRYKYDSSSFDDYKAPVYVAPVREYTHQPANDTMRTNITNIFKRQPIPAVLQKKGTTPCVGSKMLIQWVDYQERAGMGFVLLGHPVYEDDAFVDENIYVSHLIPNVSEKELLERYITDDFWSGIVHSFTHNQGQPTFFVRDVSRVQLAKSRNGVAITLEQFDEAVKNGCKEKGCNVSTFEFKDVPQMFMKMRANGTWRVICKECNGPVDLAMDKLEKAIADKNAAGPTVH